MFDVCGYVNVYYARLKSIFADRIHEMYLLLDGPIYTNMIISQTFTICYFFMFKI